MRIAINVVIIYAAWFATVQAAAAGRPWSAAAESIAVLAINITLARRRSAEATLIFAAALVGLAVDASHCKRLCHLRGSRSHFSISSCLACPVVDGLCDDAKRQPGLAQRSPRACGSTWVHRRAFVLLRWRPARHRAIFEANLARSWCGRGTLGHSIAIALISCAQHGFTDHPMRQ